MSLTNTPRQYGSITKLFHWLTALLILTALPLGYLAQTAPFADGAQVAHKAWLFSLHKTVGVAAFWVAALRILWALTQIRPGLLNGDNRLEATAAHAAHWLLYGSMLLVPITGWIHHAATTGFAPILWPFGQSLPFVPKSETLAEATSGLHFVLMLVLVGSILAHVGGALKHFVLDRDQTLQRMLPGRSNAPEPAPEPHSRAPLYVALVIWAVALTGGVLTGKFGHSHNDHAPTLSEVSEHAETGSANWVVDDGSLQISVHQFGSDVLGTFSDWNAAIQFDETTASDIHGSVEVTISVASLTLGSVTDQALGADFLDSAQFPAAIFKADILPAGQDYLAQGTLSLKGVTIPVDLPFSLTIDGDTAAMTGQATLDRRDYQIGASMPDESSLAFPVKVLVSLTATRASN